MSHYLPAVQRAAESSRAGHKSPAAPSEPTAYRGIHFSNQDTDKDNTPDQYSYCLTVTIPYPISHIPPALQPTSSCSWVFTSADCQTSIKRGRSVKCPEIIPNESLSVKSAGVLQVTAPPAPPPAAAAAGPCPSGLSGRE